MPRAAAGRRALRRRPALLAGLLVLLLLLAGTGAAAAILLPSATIVITPRAQSIGPIRHEVVVDDPHLESGTITERVAVAASGTYQDLAPAFGEVTFYNFNTVAIEVGQGTQVSAGETLFETMASVIVPRGLLTPQGVIQAGEESTQIVALAAGPGGNVPAGAITTIRNEGVAASLRGFPENPQDLVLNLAPTAGGLEASGPLIEQADVDAAVEQLRAALTAALERATVERSDRLYPPPGAAPEPRVELPEGLVGTRDQPSVELTGTITWERPYAERADVLDEARRNFAATAEPMLGDSDLLEASIEVLVLGVRPQDGELIVDTSAIGEAAPRVEPDAIQRRVAGMAPAEAKAALAELGTADVTVWPAWVGEVPSLDWRVDVTVERLERTGG